MKQIHPDASLIPLLERLVADDVKIHLFSNNVTPDKTTTLGSLTEMTGGTGYASVTVDATDFTLGGVTANRGTLQAAPISFTMTASGDSIYGYYVTDTASADLLAVARFDDAPISLSAGKTVFVTPIFGDSSLYP